MYNPYLIRMSELKKLGKPSSLLDVIGTLQTLQTPPNLKINITEDYKHFYIEGLYDNLLCVDYLSKIKVYSDTDKYTQKSVGESIFKKIKLTIKNLRQTKDLEENNDDLLYLVRETLGFGLEKADIVCVWATGFRIPESISAAFLVFYDVFERGIRVTNKQNKNITGNTRLTRFDVKNYLKTKNSKVSSEEVIEILKSSGKIEEESGFLYHSGIKLAERWVYDNRCNEDFIFDSEDNVHLNDDQVKAYNGILQSKSKIVVLAGFPGTGKTYLIKHLLKAISGSVAITSQSAAACEVLNKSLNIESEEDLKNKLFFERAVTNHKFYYSKPRKYQDAPIKYWIVDEASMMDSEIFYKMLSLIDDSTKFIFVGDDDQLPAVGPGCIFSDIIQTGLYPVFRLNIIERTDKPELNQLAHALRDKDLNSHFVKSQVKILNYSSARIFKRFIKENFCRDDFSFFKSNLLLAHTNTVIDFINYICINHFCDYDYKLYENEKLNVGTLAKTTSYLNWKNIFREIPEEKLIGLPVVFTENDSNANIYNGLSGVIVAKTKPSKVKRGQKDRYIDYEFSVLCDNNSKTIVHDLSSCKPFFASTVHKSQGSQKDNIFYFHINNSFESWQLVYTACTRAQKSCTIYRPSGDFIVCSNEERDTYLRATIEEGGK